MTQLRSANPRDTRNNRVHAGARLKIPTDDSEGPSPAEVSPPSNLVAKAKGRTLYHVVRRGENLTQIARRYGVQVDEIKEQNKRTVKGNRILAGTRLKIVQVAFQGASSSQSGELTKPNGAERQKSRYRVRRGDNLAAIAQKFGTSVRAIKSKNRLDNSRIVPGQLLVINP
jgi:membrane-bound lytic murein transglycosylase D